MAAKAILAPKHNSFQFEDRLLELSSPVRIGRSHKEDKADSGNGFFDCKVLSRNHATLVFDEGKFYVVDTGSSNGTFVNNIRLSKCGEESKVTELFTGDTLRFGSDVVDKAKSVTQKCVVAKLRLIYNDGTECDTRPVSSRLFRPSSSEPEPVNKNGTNGVHHRESGDAEKMEMARRLAEIEAKLADRDQFCSSVAIKQERDATEITKLRLLVDSQNNDIANLEAALSDTQTELDRGDQAEETRRRYEVQMKELETFYNSEEAKLRQELEEAAVTQSELLDKIKTLESESGYAQAEVEKVVIRENCEFEYKQVRYKFFSHVVKLKFNTQNVVIVKRLKLELFRSWNIRSSV